MFIRPGIKLISHVMLNLILIHFLSILKYGRKPLFSCSRSLTGGVLMLIMSLFFQGYVLCGLKGLGLWGINSSIFGLAGDDT